MDNETLATASFSSLNAISDILLCSGHSKLAARLSTRAINELPPESIILRDPNQLPFCKGCGSPLIPQISSHMRLQNIKHAPRTRIQKKHPRSNTCVQILCLICRHRDNRLIYCEHNFTNPISKLSTTHPAPPVKKKTNKKLQTTIPSQRIDFANRFFA